MFFWFSLFFSISDPILLDGNFFLNFANKILEISRERLSRFHWLLVLNGAYFIDSKRIKDKFVPGSIWTQNIKTDEMPLSTFPGMVTVLPACLLDCLHHHLLYIVCINNYSRISNTQNIETFPIFLIKECNYSLHSRWLQIILFWEACSSMFFWCVSLIHIKSGSTELLFMVIKDECQLNAQNFLYFISQYIFHNNLQIIHNNFQIFHNNFH